jgi:hypothetical protein
MFLVLLARPRYNAEGNCIFDGKICIWPFIKKVNCNLYFLYLFGTSVLVLT